MVWYLPAMIRVSKKFSPAAATFATTSPGLATGSGASASSRSSGVPKRRQRKAFTGRLIGDGRTVSRTPRHDAILRNGAPRASAQAAVADRPQATEIAQQSDAFRARRCRLHIAEFASYSMPLVDFRLGLFVATEEGPMTVIRIIANHCACIADRFRDRPGNGRVGAATCAVAGAGREARAKPATTTAAVGIRGSAAHAARPVRRLGRLHGRAQRLEGLLRARQAEGLARPIRRAAIAIRPISSSPPVRPRT